jgi:D-alanyl-D-alanine carboxypeptidase/D-alanyl-D-alanine-endopeptidase (penicillin-binding protein 4)
MESYRSSLQIMASAQRLKILLFCSVVTVIFLFPFSFSAGAEESWEKKIKDLAGDGAVVVANSQGRKLYELNACEAMIPASILKIFTAAAARHYLGTGFRFTTIFRLSPEKDLYVIGRGDPHLVSEELEEIVNRLKAQGLGRVRNIFLEDGYFEQGLILHGTDKSLNPYDAYNGALCVNFNTIFVRIDEKRRVFSAEPQTPLTDFAKRIAIRSGLRGEVRVNLAESPDQCLFYAGELLKAFLEKSSVPVLGHVYRGREDPERFPLYYAHRSHWHLENLVRKMFEHSNNFMANQIFLTMGAVKNGPPATEDKARDAMGAFLSDLGLQGFHLEEGSGISRRNRVSATQMVAVLNHFRSCRHLLPGGDRVRYKTGTLSDVKSLAGYLENTPGEPLSFAVILNGKRYRHGTREKILTLLKDQFLP